MENIQKKVLFCTLIATVLIPLQAQIEWRNNRTGIYNETGLLKSWATDGPELLWYFDGLGEGYSSVSIAGEKIYITGMTEGAGYLFVFDLNGKLLNKKEYGTEWNVNYQGARATVVINHGKLYIVSGTGNIVCLDGETLDIVWQMNFLEKFGSRNVRWGLNETPLIVGNKLILTPGGSEHNIVALNKTDGSLIWSTPAKGDLSAYCSPLYINAEGILPQIVTMTAEHIVGVNIETGELIWDFYFKERNSVHPNTPVFIDNTLFCSAPDVGSVMLRFKNGGREVEKTWEESKFDPITGHAVIIGDHIYISGYMRGGNNYWYCANRHTGEIIYRDNTISSGAVIYADGMLYCYTERGEMALVKPDAEKFNVVSQFMITKGTGPHWAHPVIHNGTLYVRHGDSLMAYKIK